MRLIPLNSPKIYSNNYSIQTQEKALNTNNTSHIPFKPSKFDCSRAYFLGGIQLADDGFISDKKYSKALKKISNQINNPDIKRIAIIPHKFPDIDALGCSAALKEFLTTQKGKDVDIISPTAMDSNLSWLDPNDEIIFADEFNPPPSLKGYDLVICVDFSNISRAGALTNELKNIQVPTLNIDHHNKPDQKFCDNFLRFPECPANSILVYELIKILGGEITPDIATPLLAGIFADTSNLDNIKSNDAYKKASKTVNTLTKISGLSQNEVWDKSKIDFDNEEVQEFLEDIENCVFNEENVKTVVLTNDFIKSHPLFKTDPLLAYNLAKKTAHKNQDAPVTCLIHEKNGKSVVSLRANTDIDLIKAINTYELHGKASAASFSSIDDLEIIFENINNHINTAVENSNFDLEDARSKEVQASYGY